MITKINVGHKFISINVVVTNRAGKPIDPTLAEITVYRVSQIDGSIAAAIEVGTLGVITLAKQDSKTGFYGAAVDTDALGEGEYVVQYEVDVSGLEASATDYFSIGQIEIPGIIIYK